MKLFSQRHKEENNLYPEIYQYDGVPSEVRILVENTLFILFPLPIERLFGYVNSSPQEQNIQHLMQQLVYQFLENHPTRAIKDIHDYFVFFEDKIKHGDLIEFLDVYELLVKGIKIMNENIFENGIPRFGFSSKIEISEKLCFLNKKFLEYAFGYEFNLDCGHIIRVDNKLTHQEIVKPCLHLLTDKRFLSANDEYLKAHEAYKKGNSKEVFINCSSSIESIMKIIIELNNWEMPKSSTSSLLIDTLIKNNFLKPYYSNILNNLKEVVSITSKVRNKEGGHGAGTEELCNDMSLMTYVINITASTILFLMEHQKELELSKS
ncbi:STM4504/CBY_0614 family protein [Francisella sp. SYW-9]|uniref:STM4504/CBY_0614 family protein n=1 Tax=Francisella sp. SYW-9 TaxID=2610888 RepID=UPI00398D0659